MINPINSTILRKNDVLSKEDRDEGRRQHKPKKDKEEEEVQATVNADGEHLELDLVV